MFYFFSKFDLYKKISKKWDPPKLAFSVALSRDSLVKNGTIVAFINILKKVLNRGDGLTYLDINVAFVTQEQVRIVRNNISVIHVVRNQNSLHAEADGAYFPFSGTLCPCLSTCKGDIHQRSADFLPENLLGISLNTPRPPCKASLAYPCTVHESSFS